MSSDDEGVPLYVGNESVQPGDEPVVDPEEFRHQLEAMRTAITADDVAAESRAHQQDAIASRRRVVEVTGKPKPKAAAGGAPVRDRSDVSRIVALEEEVRALNNTIRNQEKGITQLNLESEKQRKVIVGLTTKLDKESAENKELRKQLKIAEAMAASSKKEATLAQRAQQQQGQKGSSGASGDTELRLKRALEELDRNKAELEKVRSEMSPAGGTSSGAASQQLRDQVTDLNRKVQDLLTVVKRQNKVIDVLKRQKMHLEAARLLQFTEQEFTKILEMNES